MLAQAQRQAEAGRRLSIYDRDSGFLAPWYLLLRVREEIGRTRRYGGPLSLLVIEAPEEQRGLLNAWLSAHLRMTDLVCRDSGGCYYVLLIETGEAGASTVAKRVIADIKVSRISVGLYPEEEERFLELLGPLDARWQLRELKAA